MTRRWLLVPAALLLAAAGTYAAGHPYGARAAIGIWPVPQGTPWEYQFWSGFVPALTVLTLLGAVGSMYHVHNCRQDGCWRIGKHRVNGVPWCGRHVKHAAPHASTEELLTQILGELRAQREAA
jgi:hypothetical protein